MKAIIGSIGAFGTADSVVTLPSDLTAGDHTLRVELRNNDGSAIAGATDQVDIHIWDAPELGILAPSNGNEYNPGENVDLNVSVAGMTLVDVTTSGGENQIGEGLIRVYLDGATGDAFLTESAVDSFSVTLPSDLSAGMHVLRVSLHNNDGSVTGTSSAISASIVSPALSVLAPIPGMQTFVAGSVMSVDLSVENFSLVDPDTGTGAPAEGHIRVYLDGASGEDYVQGLDATATSFDVPLPSDIGYGDHLVRFSLRNDDGSAAGVDTEFFFLVAESGVKIESPSPVGEVAVGGELTMELSFENFTLIEVAGGLPASPGEGHYHVYLDDADGGDYLLVSWENTAVVTIPGNVVPGEHVLRVSLRENDHTPVDPLSEVFLPVIITE